MTLLRYPVQVIETASSLCPVGLKQVHKPPRAYHVQGLPAALGLLDRLPDRGLAVVGTRRPQPRAVSHVRSVIDELKGRDLVILSGLARGIDSAAHEAALRAGLPTIAVLGGALDDIYPRDNRDLAQAILETGGLLVSEHPAGTPLYRGSFLQRNRIIAGWANATWMVEASHRSGALNTAGHALGLAREVYVTPCFPGDERLAGNQGLLAGVEGTIPLYEASQLSHTWSDLKTVAPRRAKRLRPDRTADGWSEGGDDAAQLTREVARHSIEDGGIRSEDLLEWALARNWEPFRFFSALQGAVASGGILDQGGILNAAQIHPA